MKYPPLLGGKGQQCVSFTLPPVVNDVEKGPLVIQGAKKKKQGQHVAGSWQSLVPSRTMTSVRIMHVCPN